VVEYARTHGIRAAKRHFGRTRKTVRGWIRNYERDGMAGLLPRYSATRQTRIPEEVVNRIREARVERQYGASRAQVWLRRVHHLEVCMATIQRIIRRLGMPYLPKRFAKKARRPRQLKLFEKAEPGESVQIDTKVVTIAGRKAYQYTALDDCTRYRVLRLFPRLHHGASARFLEPVRREMPFAIRRLQCDHGTEFPPAFEQAAEQAGMKLRRIRPRCPQQNGKVERSHRIDSEEFWSRLDVKSIDEASTALRRWERQYNHNHDRFSVALGGLTPAEKLATKITAVPVCA
jgi:transposase InsO family protein